MRLVLCLRVVGAEVQAVAEALVRSGSAAVEPETELLVESTRLVSVVGEEQSTGEALR